MMNGKTNAIICITIIWSAGVLSIDSFTLISSFRQLKTAEYQTTQGAILSSKVVDKDGEEGTVFGVSVDYEYSVDGVRYEGDRYRYGNWCTSDSEWAESFVGNNPPGTKVPVYYPANAPGNSVLKKGIEGFDLFMLAFTTPFNASMICLWLACLDRLRRSWLNPPAGGIKLVYEPRKIRARIAVVSQVTAFLLAIALSSFASIFAVLLVSGGSHPSKHAMVITWFLILACGLIAGLWRTIQLHSGRYDLIIDELGNCLELPLTQGRKVRRRLSFSEIKSVQVETMTKPDNDGGHTRHYLPTLTIDENRSETLAKWTDEELARQFVLWLRDRLRCPVKSAQFTSQTPAV